MPSAPSSAVVFGASGAIGGALAERLLTSGRFDLVYAGMRRTTDKVPAGAQGFVFDLADEGSIEAACQGFAAPPTMVLVTTGLLHDHARAIEPEKSWRALDTDALSRMFAVNTIGPALVAKHVLGLLPRDRRSVFAALSARVGSIGDNRLGGWHGYRASKAALNMLIANFAIELSRTRPQAIAAALHPGTVESRLSAPFLKPNMAKPPVFPAQSAENLLAVTDALTPDDSGGLFAWDGARIPW